jgi:hypothetical protein
MSTSAGDGSLTCTVVRTWRARWARWADRAELQDLQRTTRRPSGRPPLATSRTWSAVRSALGWAGRPCQPGHQSPTMARWSATTRRRRSRSRASVWRSGRRTRLVWSWVAWQSRHRALPRTGRPHPMQGRSRVRVIVACACGVAVAGRGSPGSGRHRRCGVCRRCSGCLPCWRLGRTARRSGSGVYPWRRRRVRRTGVGRAALPERTPTTPAPA